MISRALVLRGARMIVGRSGLFLKKAAPDLLIFGGVASVVAGAVCTAKGTLDFVDVKEQHNEKMEKVRDIDDEDKKGEESFKVYKETAWKTFRCFAPAIMFTGVGITMILCGRGIMRNRYAALSSAYAVLNESFDSYRQRWKDIVGEEKEEKVFHDEGEIEITEFNGKGKAKKTKVSVKNGSKHPYEFIFDSANTHYKTFPGVNWVTLMNIRKNCNNILNIKGYITLAEVLEALRMPVPSYALIIGWIKDPDRPEKLMFGMEGNWALRNGEENDCILNFNCDGNIMSYIMDAQSDNYGYRCDIA